MCTARLCVWDRWCVCFPSDFRCYWWKMARLKLLWVIDYKSQGAVAHPSTNCTWCRATSVSNSYTYSSFKLVNVWRLRGNIIRTAPCWVVWHNVHSQQHTHMSSSYRSSRLGFSHCCLELYYCNMVEWSWWDSSLIWKTNWFPPVLWHCWLGHMTCKNRPRYDL